jgi:hypothetical protein
MCIHASCISYFYHAKFLKTHINDIDYNALKDFQDVLDIFYFSHNFFSKLLEIF